MNEIRINDPLHHHLAKKRPIHIIGGLHHDENEAFLKRAIPEMVLPPLNTHINFLRYTQSYSDQDHLDLHIKYSAIGTEEALPEIYDWRFVYPKDDKQRKEQKKLIMPPDNQYLCGSCWAISSASVIGDAFVVAGLVDWRPQISTAWALTCYPQGKCDGGSPALLLQEIARGDGIPSKHCLDYSFCAKNEKCNGQAAQHFQAQNLSSLVPKECGCYYGGDKVKHYNYMINKDIKTLAVDQGATSSENIQSAVKKHILLHGPVLTGYFVMRNFSSGYFTKINGGVYLERANYEPGKSLAFSDSNASGANYKGSHAVAIIGWGVAKNIQYDTNKRGDVPYWYCRNSWGPKWGGDNGYFKMAMYPFNKVAQFGKIVDIVDSQGQRHRCGGIITFTVSKPPEEKIFKTLSQPILQRLENDDYYSKSEVNAKFKPNANPTPAPGGGAIKPLSAYFDAQDLFVYFVLPGFIIFIIIMVVKIIRLRNP
jgi:Papain family cysteine protease